MLSKKHHAAWATPFTKSYGDATLYSAAQIVTIYAKSTCDTPMQAARRLASQAFARIRAQIVVTFKRMVLVTVSPLIWPTRSDREGRSESVR